MSPLPALTPAHSPSEAGNQSPSEVIMVRPRKFGFDPVTAESNAFQHVPAAGQSEEEIR
jgi:hypothetical protein